MTQMRLRFSMVVPTYNEAGGIEQLIATLDAVFKRNALDGEIVVVDDNSPDGTGAIVDRLADRYPVRCLHRPGKMGLSSGVIDGWKFARPESEALGAMDADFSHDPQAILGFADVALVHGHSVAFSGQFGGHAVGIRLPAAVAGGDVNPVGGQRTDNGRADQRDCQGRRQHRCMRKCQSRNLYWSRFPLFD